MDSRITRRAFAAALGAGFAQTALADVPALCPNDPGISNLQAPLTIDTHAHIFNGSDLQVREFLSQTTVGADSELTPLVEAMTGVLQSLGWHLAPGAQKEKQAIAAYAARLADCSGDDQLRKLALGSYQQGYDVGRGELLRVQRESAALGGGGARILKNPQLQSDFDDAIDELKKAVTYEAFEDQLRNSASIMGGKSTIGGYVQFVLHQFNHRHVNAIDYLRTYSTGSSRKVDLLVASMVDYDYWLARGNATPTSLADQVDLMGQITQLLGGRVHGFAPFCPFRETMTRDPDGQGDSIKLVKRAVETRGFIGVKLYPPMGFGAWGNTGRTDWAGKLTLLPVASTPDFGARLDRAMQTLFEYCVANDVPVMAHTNHSNGPYATFKHFADSDFWKLALDRFPGLRVSFGHFGDSNVDDDQGNLALPFLELMTRGAGTPGANTFADSGFFAGALQNQPRMRDALLRLYGEKGGVMLERLMYGTDWTMILPQQKVERYLSDFIDVMRRIDDKQPGLRARQASLTEAFFGRNAVEFLGLRKGRASRARLEKFYAANAVPTPDWMRKVDAI